MDKDTLNALIAGAVSLISLLLTWGLAQLSLYIQRKSKSDYAVAFTKRAEGYIKAAVAATGKTYVESLKASGAFDADAQAKAFNDALNLFKTMMGAAGMAELERIEADATTWVTTKIEESVGALK